MSILNFVQVYGFIYLKSSYRKKRNTENLPSAGSLFKWPDQPGWARPKARSMEFLLGLPHAFRGPRTEAIFC